MQPKLKLVVPSINVVPSMHASEDRSWAREPNLRRAVVTMSSRRRERRDNLFASHVLCVALGYLIAWAAGG